MGEAREQQPEINGRKTEAEIYPEITKKSFIMQYKWWIQMSIYTFFVIGGLSAGRILDRVYYENGGKSNWMATLVQVIGFPVLIPFQLFTTETAASAVSSRDRTAKLAAFYVAAGIFVAVYCMLFSIGLQYLPVTTYTLICATQLGFNAVFSLFLNRHKFTPYIINSLVLLTASASLLVFDPDSGGGADTTSKRKYVIGFVCTVAASAVYAMMLSLKQLAFQRLIKTETTRAIVDMTIYQNLVATAVIVAGLFAGGDWSKLDSGMEGYKLGKVSYVMNLFWTSVSWQVFGVGCIGLVFKVSSLFSNVISILGLPVAPVLAVIFLKDRFTGLKAVSMLLAMWGFVSYIYQHYLDDRKMKQRELKDRDRAEVPIDDLGNERGDADHHSYKGLIFFLGLKQGYDQ